MTCDWREVNQSGQMLQCQQHLFCAVPGVIGHDVICAKIIIDSDQSEPMIIFCTNDIMCCAL